MSKGGKIAVTILLVIGFIFIAGLLTAAEGSKTFAGLLALGLFFGLREMWKKPKKDTSSEIKLDKSQNKDDEENAVQK